MHITNHVMLHATPTHMDDSCDTIHDGRAIPKLVATVTYVQIVALKHSDIHSNSHLLAHQGYHTPPNSYEILRQSN